MTGYYENTSVDGIIYRSSWYDENGNGVVSSCPQKFRVKGHGKQKLAITCSDGRNSVMSDVLYVEKVR